MTPVSYSEKFFGGEAKVRELLTNALATALKESGLSDTDVDALCGFGVDSPDLPTCSQVLANPQRIRAAAFSIVSVALDLKLDKVLPLTIYPQDRQSVEAEMRRTNSKVLSAMPAIETTFTESGENLPDLQDQLEVFVRLKVMREIDQATQLL